MSPEQKKQAVFMGVLGVVLVGVLVFQFARPAPTANKAKSTATSASSSAAKTVPITATKGTADKSAGVAFMQSGVDAKALADSVEVLDFDYKEMRIPRDPMASLVRTSGSAGVVSPAIVSSGMQIQNEVFINAIRDKVVSGIVWDPVNPRAVVDSEIVSVGSMFPLGIEVIAIERDNVTFRGGQIELPVGLKE